MPKADSVHSTPPSNTSVDAHSFSPAMRLRYRILAAKASVRPSKPVLPPALHPTGDYKNGAEYEPFSRNRKGTRPASTLVDPIVTLMRLRDKAAAEVERLLTFLDETDGDADLEYGLGYDPYGVGDLEAEPEHDEGTNDDEPSLGSVAVLASNDQRKWSQGDSADLEDEHDGSETGDEDEPNLGWTTNGALGDPRHLETNGEFAAG